MNYQNIFLMSVGILLLLLSILLDDDRYEEREQAIPSYSSLDTRPYGSKALVEALQDLFPKQEIKISRKSLYEVLWEEDTQDINYVFIDESYNFQSLDTEVLLRFVAEGGIVLIAAHRFGEELSDTLAITTQKIALADDKNIQLRFTKSFTQKKPPFTYKANTANYYFSQFDTSQAEVLAQNQQQQAVLLRQKFGQGWLYLSSTPMAFTNYNLLWADKNHQFIAHTLGYLPQQDLYWDEYYKAGRDESQNPLRFVMSRRSLRTAFYLTLLGVLLIIVFEGQRKQRVIPVLPALQNDTLNFVKVIGWMYLNAKEHTTIAHKKIKFLREFLRQHHFIKEEQPSKEALERLATKTNTPFEEVVRLFTMMQTLEHQNKITEKELLELDTLIFRLKNEEANTTTQGDAPTSLKKAL